MREGAIARLSRIHPSYKAGSVTGTAAAATASGSAAVRRAEAGAGGPASPASLDSSDSEEDEEDEEDKDDEGDNAPPSLRARLSSLRVGKRRHKGPLRATIMPPPELCLVYSGPAAQYEVTGIVPLETLRRDPRLTVPVTFVLQTTGAEFPMHDSSQLSSPAVFRTRRMPSADALLRGLPDLEAEEAEQEGAEAVLARLGGAKSVPAASRIAKVMLEATLPGGRVVKLERQGQNISGSGVGEHFL